MLRYWIAVWKLKRAWKHAARGMRLVEATMRDMSRSERRQVTRELVAGRTIPAPVMRRVRAKYGR